MRILICLCLLIPVFTKSQIANSDSLLSEASMQSDFSYLRQKLENTHPGIYKRRSKEAMQSLMDSLQATINRPLSFLDFYSKIAFLIAETKCEHTYSTMGDKGNGMVKDWKMLPFQLFFSERLSVVVVNGTFDRDIEPGDEVVSINGRPIDSILTIIRQYVPSDGFMTASKNQALSSMNFNVAYNQFIERPDYYELEVRKANGAIVKKRFDQQLNFKDINKNALRNPVNKIVLDASKRGDRMRKEQFALSYEKDVPVAVITIRTFSADKKKFVQKIDQFFADIKEKKPTDLIIDLSYNGGGDEELAAYLMSYLIDKPTRFMEMEYLIDTSDAMFALSNVPVVLRSNKYLYIDSMRDGISKAKVSELAMELAMMEPKMNGYHGRVWLYVNGGTSSAASTFAAVAQSNGRATLIGEETAGAFSGGGTVLGLDLTLPYSGIKAHTSIIYQVFATTGKDPNRGVIPEIAFSPDFKALVGNNREWIEIVLAKRKKLSDMSDHKR